MKSLTREPDGGEIDQFPQWELLPEKRLGAAAGAAWGVAVVLALLPSLFFPHAAGSSFAIRTVDLMLQLGTCWLMIRLVRRVSPNDLWGVLAALIYAILYVALGVNATAEPDSYIGLFGLGMLLLIDREDFGSALLAGVLGAALFLLKAPLIVMTILAIMVVLLVPATMSYPRSKGAAGILAGFVVTVALLQIYRLFQGFPLGFDHVADLSSTSAMPAGGSILLKIRTLIDLLTHYFGDYFSMTMTILTAAGMIAGLQRRTPLGPGPVRIIRISSLALVLVLVSVIVSGEYALVALSRLYPFASIIAALGAVCIVQLVRVRPVEWRYRSLVIAGMIVFALLFSPLVRYVEYSLAHAANLSAGSKVMESIPHVRQRGME